MDIIIAITVGVVIAVVYIVARTKSQTAIVARRNLLEAAGGVKRDLDDTKI